jgi:glucose uptake protein GlcU
VHHNTVIIIITVSFICKAKYRYQQKSNIAFAKKAITALLTATLIFFKHVEQRDKIDHKNLKMQ